MMTSKTRASLDFGDDDDAEPVKPADALQAFDPKAYEAPKPRPASERPDKAALQAVGRASGFQSRQPTTVSAPAAPVEPRRRRNHSGRSEQVNIKATPEFKTRFQALGAKQSWSDVVLLEKLIELGEKHYS